MKKFLQFCNNIIHRDSFLRVISVFIAILAWFYIINIINLTKEKSFTHIPIQINKAGSVPDRNNLTMLLPDPNLFIDVKVSGPRSSLLNFDKDNITASLNMDSVVSDGKYNLDVKVDTGDSQIHVTEQNPSQLSIEFSKKATRKIQIFLDVTGVLPQNYYVINQNIVPVYVDVEGPEKIVNAISIVKAVVDIEGAKSQIAEIPNLLFLDSNGSNIDKSNLTISKEQAAVTVDIAYRKTVPVRVELKNHFGGDESMYTTLSYSLPEVEIQGDESIVSKIEDIYLGQLFLDEINGQSQKFDSPLPITNDYIYTKPDLKLIQIDVSFGDAKIKNVSFNKEYLNKFTFNNIPENKTPVISSENAILSVRSLPYILDRITADKLKGVVDLSLPNENGDYPVTFYPETGVSCGFMNQVYVSVDFS